MKLMDWLANVRRATGGKKYLSPLKLETNLRRKANGNNNRRNERCFN
jgi:hypothetical protein